MKYGLMSYSTQNLGDEIQSLAARRFLPSVDEFVDRDYLSEFRSADGTPVALVCNGWFSHSPENWPPSDDILPLFISMHLTEPSGVRTGVILPKDIMLAEGVVDYLKCWGPVGARDMHTLGVLTEAGVEAYFSGCLTLALEPIESDPMGDYVVAVDVPDELIDYLLKQSQKSLVITSHCRPRIVSRNARFKEAQDLLNLYQHASAVVTTRLHCAMPCLALETPVYFLDVGGRDIRLSGLDRLVRRGTVRDFMAGGFDVNHPEPNSKDYRVFRLLLKDRVTEFVAKVSKGFESLPAVDFRNIEQARYRTLLEIHHRTIQENIEVSRECREKDRIIENILGRRSWRISKPLMKLSELARRVRGKLSL